MVALIIPISIGVIAALAGLYQVLKPRLPQYSFQVRSVYPKFLQDSTLAYEMGATVKLHNDNFMSIHIYAMLMDMYYPDWNARLQHVGQVLDERQLLVGSDEDLDFPSAIWVMPPRQNFETVDKVLMIPYGGAKVMSSLSWDALQKGGVLQVPLSGVIHIKADGKVPMTLTMICENILDTWSMMVSGVSCYMESLAPGWSNITVASERLRTKLINTTWQPDCCVVNSPTEEDL
jgi:hypothetical protein